MEQSEKEKETQNMDIKRGNWRYRWMYSDSKYVNITIGTNTHREGIDDNQVKHHTHAHI